MGNSGINGSVDGWGSVPVLSDSSLLSHRILYLSQHPLITSYSLPLAISHLTVSYIIGYISSNPDMSQSSSESFQSLFNAALQDYSEKTGIKLDGHPLFKRLEKCDSVDSVSSVIQEQAHGLREFPGLGEDGKIMKSLKCAIQVLYTLSTKSALGEVIGIVCPTFLIVSLSPNIESVAMATCKGSFCRICNIVRSTYLLPFLCIYLSDTWVSQAVGDVSTSYDALVDLFQSIGGFLSRLHIYTRIPLMPAMSDVMVKIMAEVLCTLALATKQASRGRLSEYCCCKCDVFIQRSTEKFVKRVFGENEIEAVLHRLDRLTQDEARATGAQILEIVCGLVQHRRVAMDGE
jgi:hypothetical protein